MALLQGNNTLKRLRSQYRLVILNEDTYEEVVKFKLTRTSVYVLFSSVFVLMISLTAALIIFTPLKYYLPGVGLGNAKEIREYKDLKLRTDSMEQSLRLQDQYAKSIKKVLQGKVTSLDTTRLKVPTPANDEKN